MGGGAKSVCQIESGQEGEKGVAEEGALFLFGGVRRFCNPFFLLLICEWQTMRAWWWLGAVLPRNKRGI